MAAAALLLLPLLAAAAPVDSDLTGYWRNGQGEIFQARRQGSELWAVDEAEKVVVHARLEGGVINGGWIDLGVAPYATGTVTLKRLGPGRLAEVDGNGRAIAQGEWTRLPISPGAVLLEWTSGLAALGDVACAAVWCAPGGVPGGVWGSEVYTGDSSICGAAVHSGIIKAAEGGPATVKVLPGQQSYLGSLRNGVETRTWAAFPTSFTFGNQCAPGEARPGDRPDKPIAALGSTSAAAAIGRANPVWYSCPVSAAFSSVWGTDRYSDDSSVCGAAVHAGVLQPGASGLVAVEAAGPAAALQGSVRNGVTSRDYGPWQRTFKVMRELPAEKP